MTPSAATPQTGASPAVDPVGDPAEAEAVRRIWTGLGLSGIVDVHTHFMPESVLRKVWAVFDEHPPLGGPWPITYRADEDTRVATLRAFGVRAFTSLSYAHKPSMAAWLNDWSLDFAARTPGCLPGATFYPEPNVTAYVADALDRGARVAKIHVRVGGFAPDSPELDPVWAMLDERGIPTVLHAGSGPAAGAHTGPGPVEALLRRHPRLPLVVAHLGMPEYADFLRLAERHERVHLDLGDDWLRAVLSDNGARLFDVAWEEGASEVRQRAAAASPPR